MRTLEHDLSRSLSFSLCNPENLSVFPSVSLPVPADFLILLWKKSLLLNYCVIIAFIKLQTFDYHI